MADEKPAAKPADPKPAASGTPSKEGPFRVDLGEGIPTPPIKTATDNE